jgi:hypothetical protein
MNSANTKSPIDSCDNQPVPGGEHVDYARRDSYTSGLDSYWQHVLTPRMQHAPHRGIELPSLRKTVHLVAPGWDVIGAGEPALPGIALAHDEHCLGSPESALITRICTLKPLIRQTLDSIYTEASGTASKLNTRP